VTIGSRGTVVALRRRLPRGVRLAPSGWVGLVMTLGTLAVALLGPWFAPHSPTALIGASFQVPSHAYPLGLDYLGRDALSRFLCGGRTAVILALGSTLVGAAVGIVIGLSAAYYRGAVDAVVGRGTEVALAFPALILILLIVTGFGTALWLVLLAVAATHVPAITRIVRAAAIDVRALPYVEVAEARGESAAYILLREMFPNILAPIGIDLGMRFAGSIIVIAGVSFLGFGLQPPAADWGLMISENRNGLLIQPWPVVAPVIAIAALTIGVSLVVDGIRRASGFRAAAAAGGHGTVRGDDVPGLLA
jgi:peptide/nickel transport system permease protein